LPTRTPKKSNWPIPDYRYYPAKYWDTDGPQEWMRMALVHKCEDLGIDLKLRPPCRGWGHDPQAVVLAKPFTPPHFDLLRHSESQWRELAEQAFQKHCNEVVAEASSKLRQAVDGGILRRVKQSRNASPLRLRLEWTVRRYCLGQAYKSMATDKHSAERIRKAVQAILADAGLKDRK
jgi:hypothetical protein